MYNILVLSGGGTRGYLTIKMIERLEKLKPGFLNSVDMFVGTSSGSIIAAALALEIPTKTVVNLFEKEMSRVFECSWWQKVKTLNGMIGPLYSNEYLKKKLDEILQNKKLGDIKKDILIPTYMLDSVKDGVRSSREKIMHNMGNDPDREILVRDAVMRSAAPPSYFPAYQNCIDGGVIANDGSMCAIAMAISCKNIPLKDICLLNICTGRSDNYLTGATNWGLLQWARPLVSILLESEERLTEFQSQKLLGNRYSKLDPILKKDVRLDRTDKESLQILADGAANVSIEPAFKIIDLWKNATVQPLA